MESFGEKLKIHLTVVKEKTKNNLINQLENKNIHWTSRIHCKHQVNTILFLIHRKQLRDHKNNNTLKHLCVCDCVLC